MLKNGAEATPGSAAPSTELLSAIGPALRGPSFLAADNADRARGNRNALASVGGVVVIGQSGTANKSEARQQGKVAHEPGK